MSPTAFVRLIGLAHGFEEQPKLFENLSYTFDAGSTYALTGPSGSGKTTLLNILAGWLTPTRGTVTRNLPGSIQWVFQNPHGVSRRSAIDHVAFPMLCRGLNKTEAVRRAAVHLDNVGLAGVSRKPFATLSGGEAQRLMLARAIAAQPALLLVDEPTAQLDVHTKRTVNRAIASVAAGTSIVIVATHDSETRDACDRVLDLGASAC